jgi:hypothetical protein
VLALRATIGGRIDMSKNAIDCPKKLKLAVDAERGTLAKVDSLLRCLALSMECGDEESADASCYSDVVLIARELVETVMDRLDSLNLERTLAAMPDTDALSTK